ncbi:methyltransferase-like protein 17, mitochondrial [Takifugu flavidus]|uniref:methyltransferase-like protein 17, mitochondrial n=1 Tax=Takifugu flavidus TaxID=433684 RepID=UPI002544AC88|nr:methyltransferase-like protein 17, mitochondrial [Takifugu flavidus]
MAAVSYVASVVCRKAAVVRTTCKGISTAAQPHIDFLKGEVHRKHPGVSKLKTLRLPETLQTHACQILHKAQVARLTDRANLLKNFLWSRKRAFENVTLQKKAMSLEKELRERAIKKGYGLDEQLLEEQIRKKVLFELRRTTYRWTPLKYDEELGLVYMAARLAGCYAAVRRAVNEIKKRDPLFAPQTLLDFGSGLGTVVWAAHSCWSESLKEMVCVDSSGPMNILAEKLLKGIEERGEPCIKQVYFRQFLPVSPKVQFDLVTAAFTLSELPGVKDREDAVLTLWRKTNSYLVLVENGTKEGHQILMEARETLLKTQDKIVYDIRPASVFAPCPHEIMCPKLVLGSVMPCNFQQMHHPLALAGHNMPQTEKFSYLILTRKEPTDVDTEGVSWSRLVAPVQRRARHVHCRLCSPDGHLQHIVLTAKKHGRDVYRCARSSDWGDRVPIIPKDDSDIQTDSE